MLLYYPPTFGEILGAPRGSQGLPAMAAESNNSGIISGNVSCHLNAERASAVTPSISIPNLPIFSKFYIVLPHFPLISAWNYWSVPCFPPVLRVFRTSCVKSSRASLQQPSSVSYNAITTGPYQRRGFCTAAPAAPAAPWHGAPDSLETSRRQRAEIGSLRDGDGEMKRFRTQEIRDSLHFSTDITVTFITFITFITFSKLLEQWRTCSVLCGFWGCCAFDLSNWPASLKASPAWKRQRKHGNKHVAWLPVATIHVSLIDVFHWFWFRCLNQVRDNVKKALKLRWISAQCHNATMPSSWTRFVRVSCPYHVFRCFYFTIFTLCASVCAVLHTWSSPQEWLPGWTPRKHWRHIGHSTGGTTGTTGTTRLLISNHVISHYL